ncbi:hypothetical protein Hdeb2414_s0003g00097101 [Helianthus debilis subsp. tardiflorus]
MVTHVYTIYVSSVQSFSYFRVFRAENPIVLEMILFCSIRASDVRLKPSLMIDFAR